MKYATDLLAVLFGLALIVLHVTEVATLRDITYCFIGYATGISVILWGKYLEQKDLPKEE